MLMLGIRYKSYMASFDFFSANKCPNLMHYNSEEECNLT